MAVLTFDENGNQIDFLKERNETIRTELLNAFNVLLEEKSKDRSGKKRLGNRMMMQINNILNRQPKMSPKSFMTLDADDILYYWNAYYDLICYYTLYFEIVPNRQSFLKYMGLNSRQYEQLRDNQDEDVRNAIIFIEDSIKLDGFSAGESGNADSKAIVMRLSAKGDGHSMVSANDEMIAQKVAEASSPFELQRRVAQFIGGSVK